MTDNLPYMMLDNPPAFDPVETWERHLAKVQALEDFQGKDQTIRHIMQTIAMKKRLMNEAKSVGKLPLPKR